VGGRDILFFYAYMVQCVASVLPFLSWHIEHHVALVFDGHSHQKMGHVHLGFTRGVPLFFLKLNQEYKKLVKWGNTWVTCSCVTHVISIRWKKYAKSSHSKFWFVIVMQTMGINLNLQEVGTRWNLWWPTFLTLFPIYVITCLVVQQ
jgi:hypothetical protein